MRIQPIALAVLALSIAPAAATACDEAVQPTPVVRLEQAVKDLQKACVVLQQSCETAITVQQGDARRIVPAGTRRPDWEPGHLIDRDSIRTVPEPEKPETWVKVSNRNSFSWRFTYKDFKNSKKAKGRVVTAPGPRRS